MVQNDDVKMIIRYLHFADLQILQSSVLHKSMPDCLMHSLFS